FSGRHWHHTAGGLMVSGLTYPDGIAAARTLLSIEANASALQRQLPDGWELRENVGTFCAERPACATVNEHQRRTAAESTWRSGQPISGRTWLRSRCRPSSFVEAQTRSNHLKQLANAAKRQYPAAALKSTRARLMVCFSRTGKAECRSTGIHRRGPRDR